jgi:hypothetical protein
MAYVKIDSQTGSVEKYPYSVQALRLDNVDTSFPDQLSSATLAAWGVHPVAVVEMPSVSHTQTVQEGLPQLNQGTWEQTWQVTDASPQELEARTLKEAARVRMLRNQLLSSKIDAINPMRWEVLTEEQKAALRTYRQQLLDVPQQPGFPWAVNWPVQA